MTDLGKIDQVLTIGASLCNLQNYTKHRVSLVARYYLSVSVVLNYCSKLRLIESDHIEALRR